MSGSLPSSRFKRRALLALLGAFSCGLIAGAAGMWLAARRGVAPFWGEMSLKTQPPSHGPSPGRPEDMPLRLADKLCNELKLEENLREPIRRIFQEGFESSGPMRKKMGEEMKSHFARLNEKIRVLLTSEQATRFDTLIASWEKHRHDGPPPPG